MLLLVFTPQILIIENNNHVLSLVNLDFLNILILICVCGGGGGGGAVFGILFNWGVFIFLVTMYFMGIAHPVSYSLKHT